MPDERAIYCPAMANPLTHLENDSMTTPEQIAAFLTRYTQSWTVASGERPRVFHPGGGVRYPGSDDLFNPDTQSSFTDQLRHVAPDLQMHLLDWAERDGVVFTEWELTCTLRGRPLRVVGINRFTVQDEQALEAISCLDRMALLEFVEPERERATLGSLLARAVDESPSPD